MNLNLTRTREIISEAISVKQAILQDVQLLEKVDQTVQVLTETFRNGGKVLFCGNGGSAADAQHLAAEFSGRFYIDRPPLFAEALHANTSYLTAVANDYGYELVFSRLVRSKGKAGDVLVGISTSGNSLNVINALDQARNMDLHTICMTGASGGKMAEYADILLNMPSTITPRIQEGQILIGHIICELVEHHLFS